MKLSRCAKLFALGTVLFLLSDDRSSKAQQPAKQESVVQTATPKSQTLRRQIEVAGSVKAYEEVAIQSRMAGFLQEIKVDIGDRVKKGDLLAKISTPELEEEVQVARAKVNQKEAELKLAKSGVAVAEAVTEVSEFQRNEAVAALTKTQAQYSRWETELARSKELFTKGVLDKQTMDEALNQLKSAEATVSEAKAKVATVQGTLKLNRASVEKATNQVQIAESNLEVARAEYKKQLTILDYTSLRAPFDGVITRRNVHTGHFVSGVENGAKPQEPLFVLVRMDVMRVVLHAPEKEALSIKEGTEVVVRIPVLRDREITGKVARTSWLVEGESGTLRVEVLVQNGKEKDELRPGMHANARILTESSESMTLPAEAILTDGAQKYCLSVENGKATRRNLKVGAIEKGQVEILAKQVPSDRPGVPATWVKLSGTENVILLDPSPMDASKK